MNERTDDHSLPSRTGSSVTRTTHGPGPAAPMPSWRGGWGALDLGRSEGNSAVWMARQVTGVDILGHGPGVRLSVLLRRYRTGVCSSWGRRGGGRGAP